MTGDARLLREAFVKGAESVARSVGVGWPRWLSAQVEDEALLRYPDPPGETPEPIYKAHDSPVDILPDGRIFVKPATPPAPKRWRCKGCGRAHLTGNEVYATFKGILMHEESKNGPGCGPVVEEGAEG